MTFRGGGVAAVSCTLAVLVAGCGGHASAPAASSGPSANSAAASDSTAADLVRALAARGFETPNQRDTTAADCPTAGCTESVTTDRLTVRSFPTTGRAELYAGEHGLRQVGVVVVAFPPSVSGAEQQRYWQEIGRIVQ